ncbi:MAG: carboxypeptidase-like regulatory domain-containing protein [Acidobacteriaceae bacterium]
MLRKLLDVGVSLFILLGAASLAYGQSLARVDGLVMDSSKAVIPGAKVTLTNADTGLVTTRASDSAGEYSFPSVLPGSYRLTAQAKGFARWTEVISVHANDHLAVNAALSVGGGNETVEVDATAVQVDSGQRSETLNANQIQNLATVGRNAEELLPLLPGVTQGGSSQYGQSFSSNLTTSAGGIEGFNINGNRSDANTFKLDGGNMDDLTGNNGSNIFPNTEFISELTVETSNFTADQGGSPILITAVTKSGTKDFHGEGYYIARDSIFDANDWSNNFAGQARGLEKYNYPGFDISGPILLPWTRYNRGPNKKLFFFFGTEFLRQSPDLGTELADVPSSAELSGDFSNIVFSNACESAQASGGAASTFYLNEPCNIVDPATGVSLFDQNGQLTGITQNGIGLLHSLQGPNLIGPNYTDPGGLWNFAGHPASPHNTNQYVARFDWDPSDKARFFVRLARQDETDILPYGEYISGENSSWTSNVPEPSPTVSAYNSRSLNVNMVNVLTPSLTNEYSFNTNVLRQPNHYQNPNIISRQSLGVSFSGVYSNGYPEVAQIVPAFGVCDSLNTSGCGSGYTPPATGRWGESNLVGEGNYYKQTQFEFSDNLTKVKGAHNMKFGGLIGRARNDQNEAADPLEGYLVPSTWTTNSSGDEYADILTEHFAEFEQANHDVRGNMRSSSFEWYGQDSWKARKNLTIEFGIRWTFQGPWYEAHGLGSTFDPSAYTAALSGEVYDGVRTVSCSNPGQSVVPLCGTIPKTITPYGHPLTQPRVGFSWDTTGQGQTILRGGFGVYTQRDPINAGFGAILGPPNLLEATIEDEPNLAAYAAAGTGSQTAFTYGESNAIYSPTDDAHPEIYQYNLTLSQRMPKAYTFELAYVGSESRHLQIEQNIDNIPLGALWTPGTHLVAADITGNEGNYAPYTPFKQIVQIQHEGNANYNAMQTTLRRQTGKNLDFLASYTYSKALGDSDQFENLLPDPYSNAQSYHVLTFDRTNVFSIGYQYYVPALARGALANHAVTRAALNGWMFTGITTAQSGAPVSIDANITCVQLTGDPTNPTGACSPTIWSPTDTWFGTNAWSTAQLPGTEVTPPEGVYPKFICKPNVSHGGINTDWLNPNCVSLPPFTQQGNIDPPYLKQPGNTNFDLSLQKSFPYAGGGARRIDIRISAFNLLNRGVLDNINSNASFNWVLPVGATDPSQGTAYLTNGNQPCSDGEGGLGYSCGKTGHRQLEGSLKLFY